MKKICPVCGYHLIKKHVTVKLIQEPFGGKKRIKIVQYVCFSCDTIGDFFNENDEKLQKTIKKLKKNAVKNILDYFISKRFSLAAIIKKLRKGNYDIILKKSR